MEKSRIEQSSRNILFSIIYKIILLIIPFVVRTVLIYTLGINYVGLNGLFTSILSVLNLAELGFGSALVVNMYKPMAEGDKDTISRLLGYYKKIYLTVGIVVLIAGIITTPFLNLFIKDSVPSDVNLYILFIIYLLNTSISYLFYGYRNSLFIADQRNDIISKIGTITSLLMYSVQIVSLLVFKTYYIYVIILPVTTMINNFIVYFLSKKMYPEIECKKGIKEEVKKDVLDKTKALVGHKIGGIVANSLDSIVISSFLGLVILGRYNNYYYIMWSVLGIVSSITSVIVPSVANSIIKKSIEDNKKNFEIFNFFVHAIMTVCCTCLVCLYQPFIKVWVGEENLLSLYLVILMSIYFFVNCSRQIILVYKDALGLWKPDWLRPYMEALTNCVCNFVFISIMGVEGVVVATLISMGLVTIPWETIILYKHYFKSSSKIYFARLAYSFFVIAVCSIISYLVCLNIPGTVFGIMVKGLICFIIPTIVFLIAYFKFPIFEESIKFFGKIIKTLGFKRKVG